MIFRPPSKSLQTRDYQIIAAAAFGLLLLVSALFAANLRVNSGGGDFMVTWVAGRAFIFDKLEPYSGDIAARTQAIIYDSAAAPEQKPYVLTIPLDIELLYFPFAVTQDAASARAAYRLVLEFALGALLTVSIVLSEWHAPRALLIAFVLCAAFNFYAIEDLYQAAPALINALLLAAALLALREELDEVTGALLALCLYDWTISAPLVLLILLRVRDEKRTRVWAGFAMSTFLLLAVSFLLYPGWILPYLRAVVNDLRVDYGFTLGGALTTLIPIFGALLTRLIPIALIVLLGFEWAAARRADFRRFYWAACVTIAATPLLGWRVELQNLAPLLVPLALVCSTIHDRWKKFGAPLSIFVMGIVVAIPWSLAVLAKGHDARASQLLFLFLPIFTLAGLYWIRWWALNPPRTWVDRAHAAS